MEDERDGRKRADSAPIDACGVIRDRRLTTIAMPGASYDARLDHYPPLRACRQAKRRSSVHRFYRPWLPLIDRLTRLKTVGVQDRYVSSPPRTCAAPLVGQEVAQFLRPCLGSHKSI